MNKINLKKMQSREVIPGFNAKFIQSDNITMAYWDIKAGSVLPAHDHPNEQISTIIKGKFKITVENETQVLTPGAVLIIPPSVRHSGIAITDCSIIDVFYPFREKDD